VEAQAPDGRSLSISREPDGWSVSVQSSPNSSVRLRGRDLSEVLTRALDARNDDEWIAAVAAEAERKTWRPLGWRRR
jgi:hypothetical protein